jgi:hypothetical protein
MALQQARNWDTVLTQLEIPLSEGERWKGMEILHIDMQEGVAPWSVVWK